MSIPMSIPMSMGALGLSCAMTLLASTAAMAQPLFPTDPSNPGGLYIGAHIDHYDFAAGINEERSFSGKILFTQKIQELLWDYHMECELRWPERDVAATAGLYISVMPDAALNAWSEVYLQGYRTRNEASSPDASELSHSGTASAPNIDPVDTTKGPHTDVYITIDPLDEHVDTHAIPHVVLKRGNKILAGKPGPGVPECVMYEID